MSLQLIRPLFPLFFFINGFHTSTALIKSNNLIKSNMYQINYTDNPINEEVIKNDTISDNDTNIIITKFLRLYPINDWKENGFFHESYLKEINKHWLTFSPPEKRNHLILAGCYIVIMIVGLFGNLLVIVMFIRRKSIRTPGNILVMNLAVSDFLMMSKMPIFIYNSIHQGPALGEYACRYFGFLGGLSGTVSICTLAAISLDRYYVVKYPLNRNMTNTKIRIVLAIIWFYGTTFSVIPLLNLGLGKYVPEGYLTSCSFDYLTNTIQVKLFIFAFFLAAWFVPFLIITFSYSNIIYVVMVTRNVLKQKIDSSKHMKEDEKRKQETHLALIVLLVICMWFVAWTPYATVALLGITGNGKSITPLTSMVPALFCKSASCIDPFVYALTHPRFKNELKRMFFKQSLKRSYTRATSQTSFTVRRSTRKSHCEKHFAETSKDKSDENCETHHKTLVSIV